MIVSGFVVYEVLSEWKVSKEIVIAVPEFINQSLNISGSLTGILKAICLFIFFPLIFYIIFSSLNKVLAKESWKKSFTQLVIAILPITASMHLLKALLKTTSRIPYWNFVLSDPKGVKTAQLIIDNPGLLKSDILSFISPSISVIALLLSLGGILLSLLIIRKQQYKNKASKIISIFATLIYATIFLITIIAWRIL